MEIWDSPIQVVGGNNNMNSIIETAGGKNVLLIPGLVFPGEEEERESLINEMKDGLERAVEYAKGTGVTVTLEDFDAPIAPYNCIKGMKWFMENDLCV